MCLTASKFRIFNASASERRAIHDAQGCTLTPLPLTLEFADGCGKRTKVPGAQTRHLTERPCPSGGYLSPREDAPGRKSEKQSERRSV
jgi:hypothetical protein